MDLSVKAHYEHPCSCHAPDRTPTENSLLNTYFVAMGLLHKEKCSPNIFLEMKILDLGKVWRRSEAGSAGLEAQVAPDISLQSLILQDFHFFKPHNVYVIFHRGLKTC